MDTECCSSLLMRGEDGAPLDEGGDRRMARGPPMSPGPRDMREEVGVTMVGESITPRPSRYLWGEEGMLVGCKGVYTNDRYTYRTVEITLFSAGLGYKGPELRPCLHYDCYIAAGFFVIDCEKGSM